MSNTEELKKYLLGDSKKKGYLLDNMHNGKTIMLSGAWGVGKTHFWQEEIEPILSKKLKKNKKSCVYISLYGKDNIEDVKSEVFLKAYAQIPNKTRKDKNIDTALTWLGHGSRIASGVSIFGVKIDTTEMTDKAKDYQDNKSLNKAQKAIQNGGVICFDDFERKSKHIDLNDLFGVLTQLSLDFNCKVVIILNSDVFKGEEANIFKTVKEKTVNKFFHFEPTVTELFEIIYDSHKRYEILDVYKEEVLKAIIETKELNARIFIQVLDNVLEWIDTNTYDKNQLRALVLITINFLKNHFVFDYKTLAISQGRKLYDVLVPYYKSEGLLEISNYFIKILPQLVHSMSDDEFEVYFNGDRTITPRGGGSDYEEFLHQMYSHISKKEEDSNGKVKSDSYYDKLNQVFHENKEIFYALNYYAYILDIERGVDEHTFMTLNKFVKTGIFYRENDAVDNESSTAESLR